MINWKIVSDEATFLDVVRSWTGRVACDDRFLNKIALSKAGCWEWTAARDTAGYGLFRVNKKLEKAHRYSYRRFIGPIEPLWVLHRCDNPSCIYPPHLFLGTAADNAHDRDKKGRAVVQHGHYTHFSKLTPRDVLLIRRWHEAGGSRKHIAKLFCVSTSTINRIFHRKSWKHV